ncbi:hypothetical protein [Nostoc sp.]|uniref:hypothetical protein n=1 Tax=Nostoc sp. TaxID=1180 RepID=UPI002FF464D9
MADKKCYGWRGKDGGGGQALFLACATNPQWTVNPQYGTSYFFPSDNGINLASRDYGSTADSITLLNGQTEIDAWLNGRSFGGSCSSCLDVFTTYCQGSKQAKVTVSNQEHIFKNTPIKISCKGTTLKIEDNSGGARNVEVPNCNSFKVSCNDDCPEGFCKCHSDSYPGYCCNDCSSTSASLQNISNQLKRLKNGR